LSERINSFKELNVYKKAFQLQQDIFTFTKTFPTEERYSLIDQIRRSSRSIGANIAESWQKRRYSAHFISKLSDADGELAETQHWINTSLEYEYLAPADHSKLIDACKIIGRMLGKILAEPDKWYTNFNK
jgi:four helix bundle protein